MEKERASPSPFAVAAREMVQVPGFEAVHRVAAARGSAKLPHPAGDADQAIWMGSPARDAMRAAKGTRSPTAKLLPGTATDSISGAEAWACATSRVTKSCAGP